MATLTVAGCPEGALEVSFTSATPSSAAVVGDSAGKCVLHSIKVKGSLPLAGAEVAHLQARALQSGSLAEFVAALQRAGGHS